LRFREFIVERVTVIKFGVNDRGSNGTGSSGIEVRPDTAKLTNVIVAGFGERCNSVREGKMFVKDVISVLNQKMFLCQYGLEVEFSTGSFPQC